MELNKFLHSVMMARAVFSLITPLFHFAQVIPAMSTLDREQIEVSMLWEDIKFIFQLQIMLNTQLSIFLYLLYTSCPIEKRFNGFILL